MKKEKHILLNPVLLFLFISSCTTFPPEKSPAVWFGILPEQGSLYIYITEPDRIRSLLDDILPLADLAIPDVEAILSKTNKMYASVSLRENLPPLFSIALVGRYSSSCIGVGLNISRKWQKDPGTETYWKHKKTGVMAALPDRFHILIANHDMVSFLLSLDSPRMKTLPGIVLRSTEQKACTLYFPHFGEEVIPESIPINKKKLPIQEVLISTDTDTDSGIYSIDTSFNLIMAENARLFQTTFRTFIIWLMRHAKIESFTRRVKVDTKDHLVQGIWTGFTQQEIVQILKVLLSADKLL